MNDDPAKFVLEVKDMESLLRFIDVLSKDFELAKKMNRENPSSPYSSMHGWENIEIGSFLESAKAWAEDSGLIQSNGNPFQIFAAMLLAGKSYE